MFFTVANILTTFLLSVLILVSLAASSHCFVLLTASFCSLLRLARCFILLVPFATPVISSRCFVSLAASSRSLLHLTRCFISLAASSRSPLHSSRCSNLSACPSHLYICFVRLIVLSSECFVYLITLFILLAVVILSYLSHYFCVSHNSK